MMLLSLCILASLGSLCTGTGQCPPSEEMRLFHCRCAAGTGRVICKDAKDIKTIEHIMIAVKGYNLQEFTLVNVTLDYLPDDLFSKVKTEEFAIVRSSLKTIALRSNHYGLFSDSGIKKFGLDNTEITDEDLSLINDLDSLSFLTIRGFRHSLFVSRLLSWTSKKDLTTLVLEDVPQLFMDGVKFRNLKHLTTLSLSGVGLTSISRDILPEHAEKLTQLTIKNNQLTDIPKDLLRGMTSMQTVDISGNKLKTIDEDVFISFDGTISMKDNPLECDGNMAWLEKRVEEGSLTVTDRQNVKCNDGRNLFG